MADFTANTGITLQYNSNTDASPTWTGTALQFGGSSGAMELRFGPSSGTSTSTASASWPYVTRPSTGTAVVPQLWAFTTDTAGTQISTYYSGSVTNGAANILRWTWDNSGTYASAPQFGLFGDSTHVAPVSNTNSSPTAPASHNDPISNGSADTSGASYMKGVLYGGATQTNPTAGAVGSAPTVTTGTAGATVPGSNGAWSAWTSLQGFIQYLQLNVTPTATTASSMYFGIILFTGANMYTGTLTPSVVFQYSFT